MEGFIAAYSRYYERIDDVNGVLYKKHRENQVGLVIGGGSGHDPMFAGFVGRGLADAAACGNVFASPDPGTIMEVGQAVHGGKGVLFIYGNYAGDNLNFDMAEEMLQDEGIKTAHVRTWDDCASAPPDRVEDRRGIAGNVFVIKIAGAACDEGLELEEVVRVTEKARPRCGPSVSPPARDRYPALRSQRSSWRRMNWSMEWASTVNRESSGPKCARPMN